MSRVPRAAEAAWVLAAPGLARPGRPVLPPPDSADCHAGAFPVAAAAGDRPRRARPDRAGQASPPPCTAWQPRPCSGCPRPCRRSPLGSRRRARLARLDHMSILLLIAGTYTPLAVLALRGWTRLSVLAVIWGAAAAGILARLIWRPTWRPAPRWLITSLFIALGSGAVASCRSCCGEREPSC